MQTCTKKIRNHKGYTLLEVMVALLVITISLGALLQNISQSNRSAIRSERAHEAVRMAHNIFNNIEEINAVMAGDIVERPVPGEKEWAYRFFAEPLTLEWLSSDAAHTLDMEGVKKITLCLLYGPPHRQQSFCFEKWRIP